MSVTWIHGNSGAGKTTLAKVLIEANSNHPMVRVLGGEQDRIPIPTILLDGDAMRECWTLGFSKEDRVENNLRIAKIAKMLDLQGFDVMVATICPYRELRAQVKAITGGRFIYLEGGKEGKDYPYEV